MREFAKDNVYFTLCAVGFAVLYAGVAELSGAVANIVAGVVMMGFSVWPYLRTGKR